MTWPLVGASMLGVLPAALGTYIGNRLRSRIPSPQFRMVVLATLLAIGFLFCADLDAFFSSMSG
jgi:uncharacterized membrane protein YfcA